MRGGSSWPGSGLVPAKSNSRPVLPPIIIGLVSPFTKASSTGPRPTCSRHMLTIIGFSASRAGNGMALTLGIAGQCKRECREPRRISVVNPVLRLGKLDQRTWIRLGFGRSGARRFFLRDIVGANLPAGAGKQLERQHGKKHNDDKNTVPKIVGFKFIHANRQMDAPGGRQIQPASRRKTETTREGQIGKLFAWPNHPDFGIMLPGGSISTDGQPVLSRQV